MRLRFTPRALENIVGIADYIRGHNPAAADTVRTTIYESLQLLLLFPYVGRQQDTEGVRKLVTRKYAYLIYYAIDEARDEIAILSVKHKAQAREHSDL